MLFLSFFDSSSKEQMIASQNRIEHSYKMYGAEKYLGYKNCKLEITKEGFLRYHKVFKNNKTEFYSVKLDKVEGFNYSGTERSGWFIVNCVSSSVICQTFKDPAGNIDSMSNEIVFPLNNMSVDEINDLKTNFEFVKNYFK